MDKSQKKLLAVIISVVFVFTACTILVSFLKLPEFNADNSAKMTIGQAKSIVLEYVNLNEDDVAFTKQEAEINQGVRKYYFEFNDGTTEYEFKIDAHTGKVISSSSGLVD